MSSSRAEAFSRRLHQRIREAQAADPPAKPVGHRRRRPGDDWTDLWLPYVPPSDQPYALRERAAHWVRDRVAFVRAYLASYVAPVVAEATLSVVVRDAGDGIHNRLLFSSSETGLTLRGQRFWLNGIDCFVPYTRGTMEATVVTHPGTLNAQGIPVVLPTWFLQKHQDYHRDLANLLALQDALQADTKPSRYDLAQTALALALMSTRELWWLPVAAGGAQVANSVRTTLSGFGWSFEMRPTSFVAAQVLYADAPEEYTLYPLDNTTGTYNLTTYFQYATGNPVHPARYPYRGLDVNLNERLFTLTGYDQFGASQVGTYIWPKSGTGTFTTTYPMANPIITSTTTQGLPGVFTDGSVTVGKTPPANPSPGDFWIKV